MLRCLAVMGHASLTHPTTYAARGFPGVASLDPGYAVTHAPYPRRVGGGAASSLRRVSASMAP